MFRTRRAGKFSWGRTRTNPRHWPGGTKPLATTIINAFGGAGWVVPFLYLARADLVDAASVGTWTNLGTGPNATQGTGAQKPTFNASVLNGGPALSFDGGDILSTTSIDLSAYTAVACLVVMQDSDTSNSQVCEFTGDVNAVDGGFVLAVNNGATDDLMFGQGIPLGFVRSAASFPMTSPAVVTGTADRTLASNENTIRHNGVDVSSAHTSSNTSGGYANSNLFIGARTGLVNTLTGDLGALVIAFGTTSPPTDAISTSEQALRAEWSF
jgi:hypothetical protein